MSKFIVAVAAAALLVSPLAVQAQAPAAPPAYGLGISMEAAKKVMAAAEAEARKNNWPVAIAIVDSSSKLAAFSKMDNTQHDRLADGDFDAAMLGVVHLGEGGSQWGRRSGEIIVKNRPRTIRRTGGCAGHRAGLSDAASPL